MAVLDLSDIFQLTVKMPVSVSSGSDFALGLLLSNNTVISPADRVKVYSSVAAMTADGFAANSPEVQAATLYFEQSPSPSQIAVGVIAGASTPTVMTQTNGSATLMVSSTTGIGAGQSITGTGIPTGTTVASVVNDTTLTLSTPATASESSGTVTVAAETQAQALTACRNANMDWYGVYMVGAVDADVEALAPIAEATANTAYFYDTSDANVPTSATNDLATTLMNASYNHVCGIYSTTPYAGAALMGLACGLSDGTYDAFTLADKTLTGVSPEPLTQAQLIILEGKNINAFSTRLARYKLFELGVSASGADFGDVVALDVLVLNIQTAVMTLRMNSRKIGMTDIGVSQYTAAITVPLEDAYSSNFFAAGTWAGATIGSLTAGTMMSHGYSVQTSAVTSANKANKTAPPIYVCIYKAGHIQKVVLQVDVSQ